MTSGLSEVEDPSKSEATSSLVGIGPKKGSTRGLRSLASSFKNPPAAARWDHPTRFRDNRISSLESGAFVEIDWAGNTPLLFILSKAVRGSVEGFANFQTIDHHRIITPSGPAGLLMMLAKWSG